SLPSISPEDEVGSVARAYSITSSSRASSDGGTVRPTILAVSALARAFAAPPKNKRSGRAALPGPLAFPFPPSRLLAPAELCARRPGPLVSHLDNSGFTRDRQGSKKSERWFGEVETGVAPPRLRCLMRATFAGCCARTASGHAAAPPSSVMNSRRLIHSPRRRGRAALSSQRRRCADDVA